MPQGLQVFNESQQVFWDTNMFMGRTLGIVDIGTTLGPGEIVDDGLTTGIPWVIPILDWNTPFQNPLAGGYWTTAPRVSFAGNKLIWDRRTTAQPAGWPIAPCTLHYGVR